MSRWPNLKQKYKTFQRIRHRLYPGQVEIHQSTADVLQIVGAEGGGKSYVTAAEIVACVPWSNLVYLVGQSYDSTHAEFNYLVEFLLTLDTLELDEQGQLKQGSVNRPKQGSWSLVTRTGCIIVTLSVDRGASSIISKGQQPDIITLCEAGVINSYSVLTAAARRVTRVRGRVIMSGTLINNFGWYAKVVDELKQPNNAWAGETFNLPAWINKALYPGGRDDPEILRLEKILPPDEFARTIAAERLPSQALVFGREFDYDLHFGDYPFIPELPVSLWIDPGYYPSVYAVSAVQFVGEDVYNFDEVYLNHHTHQEIIAICRNREWWGNVKRAVMDIAGRAHSPSSKKSGIEEWGDSPENGGAGLRPRSQVVGISDGIAVHRRFLKGPRLFHDYKCQGALKEYQNYKLPTDRDGNPTSDEPIDDYNHVMKEITYGLADKFGLSKGGNRPTTAQIDWRKGRVVTQVAVNVRSDEEISSMLEAYEGHEEKE